MNTLATQEQLEQLEARELEALNRKVERRNQQKKDEALRLFQKQSECSVLRHRTVTQHLSAQLEQEREQHQKEMNLAMGGTAAVCLLLVALTCFVAAPWWTAVTPVLLAFAVLRKLGW